jgi:hypothetical protein
MNAFKEYNRRRPTQSEGFYFRAPIILAIAVAVCAAVSLLASESGSSKPGPTEPSPTEDLGEKLIRKAVRGEDEDIMSSILRLMAESAEKLEIEFDAGYSTQQIQEQVLAKLDEAIQASAARTRAVTRSARPARSDKRTSRGVERSGGRPGPTPPGQDSECSAPPGGAPVSGSGEPPAGQFREPRRSWGQLPMREREEVLQGINEESLERYRAWIEKYFRALQESDE